MTKGINDPWTDADIRRYEAEGSQRDTVVYNSYYNSRLILTDENIFLCSMKLKNGMYKNFYLVAVTRNLFYFIAFIPEATCLEELRDNEFIKKMFTRLTLHKAFADSTSSRKVDVNDYTRIADCCTIMVKVDANIGEFLFPKYKQINNPEIRKKFTVVNNLHSRFLKERDALIKSMDAYNAKIDERLTKVKSKLSKIALRKGLLYGVPALLGIPPVFDLDGLLGLTDLSDLAELGDMSSSILDMVDISDGLMDFSNFNLADTDLGLDNNVDLGNYQPEGMPSEDGSNISFGGKDTLPPNANSDGYIPSGRKTLDRSQALGNETFKIYKKDGSEYVLNNGNYIKISGKSTVKIDGITYKC